LPVSEILDRITICEVKLDHIADPAKRGNIAKELDHLKTRLDGVDLPAAVRALVGPLRASNDENFLEIDKVFACEAAGSFGDVYVAAARRAFVANAERAKIKRRINILLNSEIIEEKTY